MSWSLYRWIWQLESPVHVGMAPAGSINRCRLYVPARVFWGAITAELARQKAAAQFPDYQQIGNEIKNCVRFTYLYPAEKSGDLWHAWLPQYECGSGLVWRREDDSQQECLPDWDFRMRLLHTRPGTAIDPLSATAEEGSLRETECMNTFWREMDGRASSPVGLVGYVFLKKTDSSSSADLKLPDDLQSLHTLFVGGDTRYGLGKLRRVGKLDVASNIFGQLVELRGEEPVVRSARVLAHASDAPSGMRGSREALRGWDDGKQETAGTDGEPLWVPGSVARDGAARFRMDRDGIWHMKDEDTSKSPANGGTET
ncbi:MAG: hypothetical protein WHX93_07980 [bacterium]